MDELKKMLTQEVGLGQAEADKLGDSLQQNAGEVTAAAAEGGGKLSALIQRFGFSEPIAQKVADFLTRHAAELPKLLGSAGGVVGKAKDALGGLMGGK
ncbi:MAG TPA: hypothetical protein VIL46_03245 [Gemmataceae bacterium]